VPVSSGDQLRGLVVDGVSMASAAIIGSGKLTVRTAPAMTFEPCSHAIRTEGSGSAARSRCHVGVLWALRRMSSDAMRSRRFLLGRGRGRCGGRVFIGFL